MKKIFALTRYTFVENVRQRVFYTIFVFAPVIFAASAILSALGGEQRARVLFDFGFTLADFAALFTAIILGSTFIYEEIESKSIYTILSRPVGKFTYLTGRYAGFVVTSCLLLFIMAILNFAVVKLTLTGSTETLMVKNFLIPFFLSAMKISVILSVALFWAMLTTSKASSMIFTLFFWCLGHFTSELEFLGRLAANPFVKILALVSRFITPQLSRFVVLDFSTYTVTDFGSSVIYAVLYISAFLIATYLIFRRKEF